MQGHHCGNADPIKKLFLRVQIISFFGLVFWACRFHWIGAIISLVLIRPSDRSFVR